VIPKGSFDELKSGDLGQFRARLAKTMPLFADRVGELASWDQIKLLTVAVDRLKRWYRRGLICIGDAAHAMSPVGGVGVNLAVQDAVATANILAGPLRAGSTNEADLARVQERREFPTRMIQRGQLVVQNRVITGVLANQGELKAPFVVKLFAAMPILRRIPARILGIGVRPEHIRTPERARVAQPA
jgi:2-polyprenyl-6-methoxyphenol hydroxylase-like FAD-dependent oxidoreductase